MAKAATAIATTEEGPAPAKGPSMIVQIGVLLVLTIAALGGGWFAGGILKGESGTAAPAAAPAAASHGADKGHGAADAHGGDAEAEPGAAPANPLLVNLPPITTNLAAPSETWVRLEATVLFDQAPDDEIVEAVHQDLLAYMRTLKMHQIEGASGFQHLRADLEERAAIRSGGHAKNVLIRTLLFE